MRFVSSYPENAANVGSVHVRNCLRRCTGPTSLAETLWSEEYEQIAPPIRASFLSLNPVSKHAHVTLQLCLVSKRYNTVNVVESGERLQPVIYVSLLS